jgi:hypothetical protein
VNFIGKSSSKQNRLAASQAKEPRSPGETGKRQGFEMKNRYFIFGLVNIAIAAGALGILWANHLPPFGEWRSRKTTTLVTNGVTIADGFFPGANKTDLTICAPLWERGVTSHVHLGPFPFARSTYNRTGNQDCLGIEKDSDGNILGNKKIVQLDMFLAAHNKLFITRLDDGYYVNIID